MEVITPPELKNALVDEIREADTVRMAVAFFQRVPELQVHLKAVPDLHVLVSGNWEWVNPHALREVTDEDKIAEIPCDDEGGQLHAKVMVGRRRDGRRFAFVGSANISSMALETNREMVCHFCDPGDKNHLDTIFTIVEFWERAGKPIEWARSERIWNNRAWSNRPGRALRAACVPVGYWILKTTKGDTGTDYWPEFKNEGVVAIGWEAIDVDPRRASKIEVEAAISRRYPHRPAGRDSAKVLDFCQEMTGGDRILLSRGYSANQRKSVFVYGLATVLGDCCIDEVSQWWRFKRPADIEVVEGHLPVDQLRSWLNMDSCREALHRTEWTRFRNVVYGIKEQLGLELQQNRIETLDLNDAGGVWEKHNPWLKSRPSSFLAYLVPSGRSVRFSVLDRRTGQWMTNPTPAELAESLGTEGVLSGSNRCRGQIHLR